MQISWVIFFWFEVSVLCLQIESLQGTVLIGWFSQQAETSLIILIHSLREDVSLKAKLDVKMFFGICGFNIFFSPVTWWLCAVLLFIRSLAYNNLETLPRDVFSGMEALTKVWVHHLSLTFN